MDIKQSKNRFGIIGNDIKLNQAINVALQVASTDISVIIIGGLYVARIFFLSI